MLPTAQAYAEACHPEQWRVLGVPLRPFCIGHSLLLARAKSPLMTPDAPFTRLALISAVWICSRPYDPGRWVMRLGWSDWWWALRALWRLQNKEVADKAWSMLAQYILEARNEPKMYFDSTRSRRLGSPGLLANKRVLMSHYHYTATEALNLPFGQALWEIYAHLEAEGAARFASPSDLELDRMMADHERAMAA